MKLEKIKVKLHARKLDKLDKQIFTCILEKSCKYIKDDQVVCWIDEGILMDKFAMSEADIYSRVRKYVSLGLDEYSDTIHTEYNFCTLVKYNRDSKPSLFEITFYHLEALRKHFHKNTYKRCKSG